MHKIRKIIYPVALGTCFVLFLIQYFDGKSGCHTACTATNKMPAAILPLLPMANSTPSKIETFATSRRTLESSVPTKAPKPTLRVTNESASVGLITYVGTTTNEDKSYIREFRLLLYASWRFVTTHPQLASTTNIKGWSNLPNLNVVDLLVFLPNTSIPMLPKDCTALISANPRVFGTGGVPEPRCFAVIQDEHQFAKRYGYINSFVMAYHPHFDNLMSRYTYIFRVDTDTLLTPGFLAWLPNPAELTVSFATASAYSSPTLSAHFAYIARRLNLTYQGVHSVAPSFYMRPNVSKAILQLSANITEIIVNDTFLPNNSAAIPWTHIISSLYATELAMNHLVANLSNSRIAEKIYDVSASLTALVETVTHLHTYHQDTFFQKFQFYNTLNNFAKMDSLDPRMLLMRGDLTSIANMTCYEYTTYIAWNAVARYDPLFSLKVAALSNIKLSGGYR